MSDLPDFKSLFEEEHKLLSEADKEHTGAPNADVAAPGPAGEPWIQSTRVDRVGLAFSGGGIRSATFNLGVLKALHDLRLLKHVDYLSTVSGGGYIGAWWCASRARWGKEFPTTPPCSQLGTGTGQKETGREPGTQEKEVSREPEEVRHLREFGNFLSPRIGFFQSEMWNAVIAVVSAVLPAVMVASAVMAVAFLIWLGVTSVILADALRMPMPRPGWLEALGVPLPNLGRFQGWVAPGVLAIFMVVLHLFFELRWSGLGKAEKSSKGEQTLIHALLLIGVSAGIFCGWEKLSAWSRKVRPKTESHPWEWATSIKPPQDATFSFDPAFSPYLFAGPILWIGIAIVILLGRLVIMRARRERAGPVVSIIDRALSRLLGTALVVAAIAVLWLAGCWVNYTDWGARVPAGGALVSGGAFALLRNWMGRLGSGKKGGVMDMIKPLVPQILAYVAIGLWAICVAALLAKLIHGDYLPTAPHCSPWTLFAAALGIVVFAIFFFDPAQVSMHSFYRNRLSRAYLGASNINAVDYVGVAAERNRQTDVRWRDDIELCALSPSAEEVAEDQAKPNEEDRIYASSSSDEPSRVRPLLLVCCAANDLGGDHLENLSRGSRSAVLSKFGYAIGNHWKAWKAEKEIKGEDRKTLGLGSAITASAAAFNSNMGSVSMSLGAGVTFLCTALNLRLGLWLPHPLSAKHGPGLAVGWLFFKEMFGLTNSGLQPVTQLAAASAESTPVADDIHLSDGAHFENLALYELVRRHCRYIIVSDCGADAEVSFDDFGNAVRRIREDFGAEVEIDLAPLKPNEARLSKQHVAVGTIYYNPRGDRKDSAILVYFKPALTGDEPCDIAQYRTRNEAFPHESTGDQFYDEAQWESYRRLGEHAAYSAFRFVERERRKDELSPDEIFSGARWEWYQSPVRWGEKLLELTGRLAVLEQQLRQDAPRSFVQEMYPELGFFPPGEIDPNPAPVEAPPEETSKALHFLTQMIQLMEDVWVGSDLEEHWNDPNNLGWMNTFQRWAYTPSFRLWWPILKPMYGRKFRRFAEERLNLADEDYPETMVTVVDLDKPGSLQNGVAQIYWRRIHGLERSEKERGKARYAFDLMLTHQKEETDSPFHVQAGLAFIDLSDKPIARWNVEDLFVPPSLWGAGLGALFLRKLLDQLQADGFDCCEVTVESEQTTAWTERTDVASRQQLNDLIAFYLRANFRLENNFLVWRVERASG